MKAANFNLLRYPVGTFAKPQTVTREMLSAAITELTTFPSKLKKEVENLREADWNLKYRPGGWTIRQVIHHCADSHMIGYIRFKLALTQDVPLVNGYEEFLWAELADTTQLSITHSVHLLEHLHKRWTTLIQSLNPGDLKKSYRKGPNDVFTIEEAILLYAWHSKHHLAHVQVAKKGFI
jgi:hypothetical protein